ncbi:MULTISPECIES: hypothetical protein [Microbacterium]|uniref:hypothetical protein n=1 Tax=Microbacterium TaxID=33882 RepID=UPI001EF5D445|nr:hypothetical protein [Microbacterium sp. KCTC 39802]
METATRSERSIASVLTAPAARIASVYVAARLVTTTFFLIASTWSPRDSRFGNGADLWTYIGAWDAQWYRRIAEDGYPAVLPLTDAGDVAQNAWAFMPLYPWASAALGSFLGSWAAGAVVISLVAGYACCLVLRSILVERMGEAAAMWAVVFFAAAPLAAMFQVAYAEASFLLLVLLGIRCLQRRRYGWLFAIVPVMAFTRPGVLAFALLLVLFAGWRWMRRRAEPLRPHELLQLGAAGASAVALGLAWQVIAGAVTGRPDAYLDTELSWRRLWMGDTGAFVPGEGWLLAADHWLREWGIAPVLGPAVVVGLVIVVGIVLAVEPHVKRLGIEIRLWAASYLLYLLAVFLPQSSVFRLLFPLAPLAGALALPASTAWRIGVLVVSLLGQWWWIWNMYGLGTEFWHIP